MERTPVSGDERSSVDRHSRADAVGIRIRIRTLDHDSAPAVLESVYEGLSDQSRYLRFHAPMPSRPARSVTDRLVDLDGRDRAALVAEAHGPQGWRPIGVARLTATGGGRAELAMSVVDSWQGRGVGRRLLAALVALAADLGHAVLYGDVLPENAAMLHLLHSALPGSYAVRRDGVIRVSGPTGLPELTDEEFIAAISAR